MARDIILSSEDNSEILILPVVHDIDRDNPQNNIEFETINNGTLNIPGEFGVHTWTITSYLPSKEYPWMRPGSLADPHKYIAFIDKMRKAKKPIRIIVSKVDGSPWFNRLALVDSFPYVSLKNGDVRFVLELSGYRSDTYGP